MKGCAEVLYWAAIIGRMLGNQGVENGLSKEECAQLAALMDAVHNIPHQMTRWSTTSEEEILARLRGFDTRWPWKPGFVGVYEKCLSENATIADE